MLNIFQQGQFGRRRVGGAAAGAAVTFDPAKTSTNWTLSNGNLTATSNNASPGAGKCTLATQSRSTGAYYFEVRVDTQSTNIFYTPAVGIALSSINIESYLLGATGSASYGLSSTGRKRFNGTDAAYGNTISAGDIVMLALNLTTGKIWWGENGTWFASGDPGADTNPAYTGVASSAWFPAVCYNSGNMVVTARFKSADFTYSPPSGFLAWE